VPGSPGKRMLAEVSAPRWLDLGLLPVGSGGDQQAGAHWPGGDLVEWPSVSLRECGGPGGADCPPVVGEPLSGWPPGPADGGGHGPSSGNRRSPVSSTATRHRRETGAAAVRLDAMLDGSARTQSAPRRRGCGSTTARRAGRPLRRPGGPGPSSSPPRTAGRGGRAGPRRPSQERGLYRRRRHRVRARWRSTAPRSRDSDHRRASAAA
jgi:hypothetical protein